MPSIETLQETLKTAQSLPLDVNPYSFYRQELLDLVIQPLTPAFYIAVYIFIGLLSASFCLGVATIFLRTKTGNLWFFKRKDTSYGVICVPNSTSLFMLFSGLYSIMAITFVSLETIAYRRQSGLASTHFCEPYACLLIVYSVLCEAQGITILLFLSSPGRPRVLGIPINAWMINAVYLSAYIAVAGSIIFGYTKGAMEYDKGESIMTELLGMVSAKAKAWNSGEGFTYDAKWTPILLRFGISMLDGFEPNISRAYRIMLGNIIVVTSAFLPLSFVYLRMLAKQLRELKGFGGSNSQHDSVQSTVMRKLRRDYQSMAIEAAVVLLAAMAYLGLYSASGFFFFKLMTQKASLSFIMGSNIGIYSCLALCVNGLLFMRAWTGQQSDGKAIPKEHTSQASEALPIQAQHQTQTLEIKADWRRKLEHKKSEPEIDDVSLTDLTDFSGHLAR